MLLERFSQDIVLMIRLFVLFQLLPVTPSELMEIAESLLLKKLHRYILSLIQPLVIIQCPPVINILNNWLPLVIDRPSHWKLVSDLNFINHPLNKDQPLIAMENVDGEVIIDLQGHQITTDFATIIKASNCRRVVIRNGTILLKSAKIVGDITIHSLSPQSNLPIELSKVAPPNVPCISVDSDNRILESDSDMFVIVKSGLSITDMNLIVNQLPTKTNQVKYSMSRGGFSSCLYPELTGDFRKIPLNLRRRDTVITLPSRTILDNSKQKKKSRREYQQTFKAHFPKPYNKKR